MPEERSLESWAAGLLEAAVAEGEFRALVRPRGPGRPSILSLSIKSGRGIRPFDAAATGSMSTVRTPAIDGGCMSYTSWRRELLMRELTDGRLTSIGIFGADVCQICGKIDTFWGLMGAMSSHHRGVFVGSSHRHDEEDVTAALAAHVRYCEVCLELVPTAELSPVRQRFVFLHEQCAPRHDRVLSRRRYCDIKFPAAGDLALFLDRLDRMRLVLASGPPGSWAMYPARARPGLALRALGRRIPPGWRDR